jgi:hypothetical protein
MTTATAFPLRRPAFLDVIRVVSLALTGRDVGEVTGTAATHRPVPPPRPGGIRVTDVAYVSGRGRPGPSPGRAVSHIGTT